MTSPASSLVFGLDTFGDLNHEEGRPVSHAQTIRNVVEQGVLTEDVGSISFGIGGHHPEDFLMPDGDVVLAAIAAASARRKSSENWAERAGEPPTIARITFGQRSRPIGVHFGMPGIPRPHS